MPKSSEDSRIRVIIRPIVNSPDLSEKIGYLASQQRRAYNRCISWLNREPELDDMRSEKKQGPSLRKSLRGRITELRQTGYTVDSTSQETGWADAPRWVHDAGAKLAHLANRRFRDDRANRLDEIRRIEDKRHEWAADPPQTEREHKTLAREERRYARLTRSHRRTVKHRSRKNGTQTLEVDNILKFCVYQDRNVH